MTPDIAFVLIILAVALVLFISEKLRMDLVAMLVLAVLAVGGLVNTEQALEGFSNPAVVTVWAMFILSAGLSATGVADIIGQQVLRIAGKSEPRIIFTVMMATGGMSAFMNNIGVAALMLPVVMDIARRTNTSPSRLLMPMAYASLLGGLTTMVGTPPNLVAASALEQAGHEPFTMFSFTPIGLPAMIAGSIFVALIGRHLLPKHMPTQYQEGMEEAGPMLQFDYEIENRLFKLRVREDSPLVGGKLADSQLGATLGLSVYAVARGDQSHGNVDGDFVIEAGDILYIHGSIDEYRDFIQWQAFEMARGHEISELLAIQHVKFLEVTLADSSELIGKKLADTAFSSKFGGHIFSIVRDDETKRKGMRFEVLQVGDLLVVETREENIHSFTDCSDFSQVRVLGEDEISTLYPDDETLFELRIPDDSYLTGMTIAESGLRETLRLRVVGIARKDRESGSTYFPTGGERFEREDKLLVHGSKETADLLQGLQSLELVDGDALNPLQRNEVCHTEITLSPRSSLTGKTLKELNFRKKYGLQVLAIWRRGKALTEYLWKTKLEFGDALLLSGSRERIEELTKDPDFLVLTRTKEDNAGARSKGKAILASSVLAAVVLAVLFGVLPIAVAAIAGVVVMVVTRCLSMDEAYRSIEWQSVFLIACMIPLGTAMQQTGAAQWIAEGVATVAEPFGPWGMIIGLYLVTAAATTIVPTTALVLIMAPIAMDAAGEFGIPPHMIMMAVAMAASASFTSPISHPANVLVMGPGGYRFIDYVKMGLLLAIVVMLTVLPMIAIMDWG